MPTDILTTDKTRVNDGAGFTIHGQLYDADNPQAVLAKATIATFRLTLYAKDKDEDPLNGSDPVNDRDNQDVLDANGGYVDSDGTYRVKLDALDTTMISSDETEWRIANLAWTWDDDDGDTRRGEHDFWVEIQKTI